MVIDSHCHIEEASKELLDKLSASNELVACVSLGADVSSSKKVCDIAKKYEKVYACVGIHPENVSENLIDENIGNIKLLAEQNKKVVGIGEIGLDYHYTTQNKDLQKTYFEKQIKLAFELKLPFCVHCRDAVCDVYEILVKNRQFLKYGFVMHCYCEGKEWVEKFAELGAYFSFAGNFTYKGFDKDVVKKIDKSKILVETDSPYLTPVPFRGKENNPLMVAVVAQAISQTLSEDYQEFCKRTILNAQKFYNIKIKAN